MKTINAQNATVADVIERRVVNILDELSDDELISLYRDANSYDGSFEEFSAYDLEELVELMDDKYEIARAIIYGNVRNVVAPVRFNGYGNLESVDEYDLASEARDWLQDLASWIRYEGTQYLYFRDDDTEERINKALALADSYAVDDECALAACKLFANVC